MNDSTEKKLNLAQKSNVGSCRPRDLLIRFGKQYTGLWQLMDSDRESLKENHPIPRWSFTTQTTSATSFQKFLKLNSSVNSNVAEQLPQHIVMKALTSHFLYSWRATQGIYRVDIELLNEIVGTEC